MVTLRDGDARAVDLLLDKAAAARGDGGSTLFAGQGDVSGEQLAAVERLLNVLSVMPAADPASDLLRRTLDRIASDDGAPLHRDNPLLIDLGRPVA